MAENENPGMPAGETGSKMLDRMNTSHKPLRAWGFPHIEWTDGMRILDAGCGGGAAIREMLDLSKGSFVDGVDYSEVSVEKSKQTNAAFAGSRVSIQQADIASLPFSAGTFDLVTAVETVYFWPHIDQAFKEIFRVLKSGGIFCILNEGSDPKQNDWKHPDDTFFRVYYPDELTALMKQAGFSTARYYRGPGQYICVLGRKW